MYSRIKSAVDWVYQGWRKDMLKKLGLNKLVQPIYNQIRFQAHPDTTNVEIADEKVNFHTSLPVEVRRFSEIGERNIIEDLLNRLSDEDIFFDIGANVGTYTVFAATKTNNIYSFDPIQDNLMRLNENLSLNSYQAKILPIALSNKDGIGVFNLTQEYDSTVGHAGHILSSAKNNSETEYSPVDQLPVILRQGDSMINEGVIQSPTVIKIDVDGSEHLVLEGLSETLSRDSCRLVYVENHRGLLEEIGVDWRSIEKTIEGYGFETSRLNIADRSDESDTYILRGIK